MAYFLPMEICKNAYH